MSDKLRKRLDGILDHGQHAPVQEMAEALLRVLSWCEVWKSSNGREHPLVQAIEQAMEGK